MNKVFISLLSIYVSKGPLEAGLALLRKPNKTPEEEKAAKSFAKVMLFVIISFSFTILSLVIATSNFILATIFNDSNSDYTFISLEVLLIIMIISPILLVSSALISRRKVGKEWINYYNTHIKHL